MKATKPMKQLNYQAGSVIAAGVHFLLVCAYVACRDVFFKTGHSTSNIVPAKICVFIARDLFILLCQLLIITLAATAETQYPAVRPEISHREFIF